VIYELDKIISRRKVMNIILYHLVKPIKPYWLYLRFKIFRLLSDMRKDALVRKYIKAKEEKNSSVVSCNG
jgi:hypothetical protein